MRSPSCSLVAFEIVGLCLTLAFTAAAEESPPDPNAPTPAGTASSPEDQTMEQARLHFAQGMRLVREEQWSGALAEFEVSLQLHATQAASYNRALCLKNLNRYTEALAAFNDFIERYGSQITPEHRAQVERYAGEIRVLLTQVTVRVSMGGATISVNDEEVGTSPLARPLLLLSGPYTFEVRRDGYEPLRRTVVVVAGREMLERFDLVERARIGRIRVEANVSGATVLIDGNEVGVIPYHGALPEGNHEIQVSESGYRTGLQTVTIVADEDRIASVTLDRRTRLHRGWFWATFGLTVTGALTTAGLALAVYMLNDQYDPLASDGWDQYNQGHALIVGADVSLGVSCVTALATLLFGLFTDWDDRSPSRPTEEAVSLALHWSASTEGGGP